MCVCALTYPIVWILYSIVTDVSCTSYLKLDPAPIATVVENDRINVTCVYAVSPTAANYYNTQIWGSTNAFDLSQRLYGSCYLDRVTFPKDATSTCRKIPNTTQYEYLFITPIITRANEGQRWTCEMNIGLQFFKATTKVSVLCFSRVLLGTKRVWYSASEVQRILGSVKSGIPRYRTFAAGEHTAVAPSVRILNGSQLAIIEGTKTATLSCSAVGNPSPSITWTNVHVETFHSNQTVDRLDFIINDVNRSHHGIYTCSATNTIGQAEIQFVTVDVYFAPSVTIINGPVVVLTEANTTCTLVCHATGNPLPIVTWTNEKGDTLRSPGATNRLDYIVLYINKSKAGVYRCSAANGIGEPAVGCVTVHVHYALNVTVVTKNGSVNDHELSITCAANGISRDFIFSWSHAWPGYGVVRQGFVLGPNNILTLTNLTYQQSGLYSCTVWNNDTTSNTSNVGHGNAFLQIESFPIITDPILKDSERLPVIVLPGGTVNISILYFSNAGPDSISCHRITDVNKLSEYNCSWTIEASDILLPVFSHVVPTRGQKAHVSMTLVDQTDFELCDIYIRNKVGWQILHVRIVAEGPPEVPGNVHVDIITDTSATVSWIPGYHGGLGQTIVIQIQRYGWRNVASVKMGRSRSKKKVRTTIDKLEPNTRYAMRLFAYNIKGNSAYTNETEITTGSIKSSLTGSQRGSTQTPLSAFLGGCVAALILLVLLLATLVLWRRARSSRDTNIGCLARRPVVGGRSGGCGNGVYGGDGNHRDHGASGGRESADTDTNGYITPVGTLDRESVKSQDSNYAYIGACNN